jgi:hypothetical protein
MPTKFPWSLVLSITKYVTDDMVVMHIPFYNIKPLSLIFRDITFKETGIVLTFDRKPELK